MGNSIGGRRKGAKVMQLDGTAFRVKPPAFAGTVLRDHPGFQLLESEEVKLLGVRACALITPHASIGTDVDKEADLELARQHLTSHA